MIKKKILFVITKSNFGGAQKYVHDLATNFPRAQFDVVVACGLPATTDAAQIGGGGLLMQKLAHEKIRTIHVPFLERDIRFFRELKAFFILWKLFRDERPDIVHLNSSKVGGIGACAARIARVPKIIFTAHGWAFNEQRNIIWEMSAYIASWFTVLLTHTTITISYAEEKQALAFPFVKSSKLAMIYIAGGSVTYRDKKSARRFIQEKTHAIPPEHTVWIGSVGELHRNKGYEYAFAVFRDLKEEGIPFFYCVIGEGEEREELEKLVKKYELEDTVMLPGAIPDPTAGATLMKAFDIFLLPSTKEGLPYVVLEAGYAGIPIVATYVGGIPEIITNEESGLLATPGDVHTLRKALRMLLLDERLRGDYAERLSHTIKETFSFERMVRETLRIYEA